MPKEKGPRNGKLKIRGGKEVAEEVTDYSPERYLAPNPIKTQIKLTQFPWTEKQKEFFRIALHPSTKVVFVNGPAGTSKTLLSVYCALQMLNMKIINNILYLRSAVESSANSLGFLPGSAEEKLKFYNLPFLDKLDELLMTVKPEKLVEQERVSMFPVNFARGMNWQAKAVILDEAQNSTAKEIITVLTRLGEGSKAFVLSDPMQTDIKNPNQIGGCRALEQSMFSDEECFEHGVYYFEFNEEDIMRSELVKFLVRKFRDIE